MLFIILLPNQIAKANVKVLKYGDREPEVITLKENLKTLGFLNLKNPNNYFGVQTREAVTEFQSHYGLEVDGIAGPATQTKINEIIDSPFQNGRRHVDTIQLKKDLDFLGYKAFSNPTNYYGVQTQALVEAFQKDNKLPISGIADSVTRQKIKELANGPMFYGLRRDDVITLKQNLKTLGFLDLKNPNNYFGIQTREAVRSFQTHYQIKADGVAGVTTQKKIKEVLDSPFQNGRRHPDTIQLKKDLDFLGYKAFSNPTDFYGVQTKALVESFQEYYDLPVSGIADHITRQRIKDLVNGPMFSGLRRDDVITLKDNLTTLGFENFKNPNNYYASRTEKAVKDFQRYFQLSATGVADKGTVDRIEELINSPFQNGRRHPETIQLKKDLDFLGYKAFKNPTDFYGVQTKELVESFQGKYKLPVSGIADSVTRQKVKELVEGPMFNGLRRDDVIELKLDLNALGFSNFKNPTNFYGPQTESAVKAFQRAYGLKVDGIADSVTVAKIKGLLENPGEEITYTNYDITFGEALNRQMNKSPQTDKYRNSPAYISGEYVEVSQEATIYSTGNVNLRSEPKLDPSNIKTSVPNGTRIVVLGEVQGDTVSGSKVWYKIEYDKYDELYVHSSLVNLNSSVAKTTANLNVRSEPNANSHSYGLLSKGSTVTIQETVGNWYRISYNTWRNATRSDVEQYLNPDNNNQFQHLLLSSSVQVSASELNKVLKGQGTLDGLGQAFIDGGESHQVNEIYLISHAFLETGRGTSKLATGVEVGKDKSGKLVLVTKSNRNNLTAIKTTYNMFGIGAIDSDPLAGGAIRAYQEGWFTPADAIKGGAKFVGQNYVNNSTHKQDTLYKMRWNPQNPGVHQYATDIAWATKQVTIIEDLYNQLTNPNMHFNIPVYK